VVDEGWGLTGLESGKTCRLAGYVGCRAALLGKGIILCFFRFGRGGPDLGLMGTYMELTSQSVCTLKEQDMM
jgi:hypothetical protein